jgi:hypothetical protein
VAPPVERGRIEQDEGKRRPMMCVDFSTTWTGALGGSFSSRGAVREAYGDGSARGCTRAGWRRERCCPPTRGRHKAGSLHPC